MATTDFGSLSTAQKRVWSGQLWKQYKDESFFMSNGFVSTGMQSPIQQINNLTKTERGLECVMQMVNELESDGVAGDNILEGKEEAMVNDAQTIRIDQLRHGVRSKGKVSEQATIIRFREQAKEKLGFWLTDKLDELMFLTAAGRQYTYKTDLSTRASGSELPQLSFAADVAAPSTNRVKYAGSATSEATLTSSDKMSWEVIVRAKTHAHRQGVRPIRQGGKEYYAIVMSPEQRRDLLLDSTYQTIVSRAAERGSNNPLFKNALAVVDGVILYDHRKTVNTTGLASSSKWGSGGTVEGAQATLLGACAMGFAAIENGQWSESDNTDYGNRPGIGYGRMIGLLKPQFKPTASSSTREDYGTVAIKTAAAL
jgi:N4-gp56 family major capsid protein